MVNNIKNLSRYDGAPPATWEDRVIDGGPLYPIEEVLRALELGESALVPWTRKCSDDLMRLALEIDDAVELVREALGSGRYRNSEWCVQSPSGPWAACDAYELRRREWIDAAHKHMVFECYVKFAIGRTGKVLLLVSCHTSEDRGGA